VLYSAHGLQWASQAQKAINIFLPDNKLLIGYLTFNYKGLISRSDLLIDTGRSEVAGGPDVPNLIHGWQHESLNYHTPSSTNGPAPTQDMYPNAKEKSQDLSTLNIDHNHPLFLQLSSLAASYKKSMQPIDIEVKELLNSPDRKEMITLLDRLQKMLKKSESSFKDDPAKLEKNKAAVTFLEKLENLLTQYDKTVHDQEDFLKEKLIKLYQ
jgi:hypothetical protein